MKRKTYVRRGAIILAVMMLVSLCGMLPTAALAGWYRSAGCCRRPRWRKARRIRLLRRRKLLRCRIISSAQSIQR